MKTGFSAPLQCLALSNNQHVQVTVAELSGTSSDLAGYFEPEEWEASKRDEVSLEEVRLALSSIQGCLSDTVIASREVRL